MMAHRGLSAAALPAIIAALLLLPQTSLATLPARRHILADIFQGGSGRASHLSTDVLERWRRQNPSANAICCVSCGTAKVCCDRGCSEGDCQCVKSCFHIDTEVQTPSGVKTMRDLALGDKILAVDGVTGAITYQSVYFNGHPDPLLTTTFINITTDSTHSQLLLTPSHLIITGGGGARRTVPAHQVHVGDTVLVSIGGGGAVAPDTVRAVSLVRRTGVSSPLVSGGGELVAGGLVASVYSEPSSYYGPLTTTRLIHYWGLWAPRLMHSSIYPPVWRLVATLMHSALPGLNYLWPHTG